MASAPSQPIRIAIIGFSGVIGLRHTSHVLSSPSTTLAALIDPSPTATATARELSPDTPFFSSIASWLSSSSQPPSAGNENHNETHAAIICTPNRTHAPIALELIANKTALGLSAILVEKPLSHDLESGREIVRRAQAEGVKVLVGHHRRFNPYVVATKRILEGGPGEDVSPLGDITAFSGLWTAFKPDEYFADSGKWRLSREAGGGPVLINLVHEVDLLQYLLGPVVRVQGEKTISRRRRGDGANAVEEGKGEEEEDGAEEGAALTLKFESGIVGTYVLSDCVVSPHSFEAGTGENPLLPRARGREGQEVDVYRFFGTKGTLSVPDMTLWTYEGERNWMNEMVAKKVAIDDDPRVPFERQLDHLVRVVRGEEEPRCSGEDGLRALVVCDAVRRVLDDEVGNSVVPSAVVD
ncbi:quinate utilization oxidoreductase QutH [Xylariomycetidae sp. FL2044]|nr:quinate utilization oxidoreductase QutH [Xylariomycetidae sp. FL2044]